MQTAPEWLIIFDHSCVRGLCVSDLLIICSCVHTMSVLSVANKDWPADHTEHAKCQTEQRVSGQRQSP